MKSFSTILVFLFLFFNISEGKVKIRIVTAKPAVHHFAVPAAPGPNFVWVSGEWVWNARKGTYVYRQGFWVRSKPGRYYKSGYWQPVHGGYSWKCGHWTVR